MKKRKHTVAIVAGCLHMPYVLEPAFKLFLKAVDIIKPDILIINGDGMDFAGICPRNKNMRDEVLFEEQELRPARKMIDSIEAAAGNADRWWLEGNHEKWWEDYYEDKPAVRARTWYAPDAFNMEGWKILTHNRKEMPYTTLGDLTVTHGTKVRGHSGWTAKAELLDRWRPILMAHTHRLGAFYFTPADEGVIYDAYEIGCLADKRTSRKYMKKKANWQPGFSVVSFDKSGWFDVALKKISRIAGTDTYRMGLHEGIFTERIKCKK